MIIDTTFATDRINYDCADRSLGNLSCISYVFICVVYHPFLLQAIWDLNFQARLLFRKSRCHDVSPRQCTYGGALGASCDLLSRLVGVLIPEWVESETHWGVPTYHMNLLTVSRCYLLAWCTPICHDLPCSYVFVLFGVKEMVMAMPSRCGLWALSGFMDP